MLRNIQLVHPSLDDGADVLSGYIPAALGAVIGFVLLNTALITLYIVTIKGGDPDVPPGVQFAASGIGLLVPTLVVLWWLDDRERTAAFPFRVPSVTEAGWALAFIPLGIAAFELGIELASTLGFEFVPLAYDLANPLTVVGVLVGPVLLAPLLEEALFRGLLLGSFLHKGWSPLTAGVGALFIFSALHVWLGIAGMVGIAAWTVFPTILRLRFNNLSGAVVLHFFNNIYAYVIVAGLIA